MAENQNLALHKHHRTHWQYLRRRRTRKKVHTEREIFYGQIVSLVGASAAGLVLEASKGKLAALVGAYLILPGIFDLSGSAAGAMGARLNHTLVDKKGISRQVSLAVVGSLLLVMSSAVFLAIFSAIVATVLFGANASKIFAVTVGAVGISAVVGFPIVAVFTMLTKKGGLDPDNFIGPVESSIFDILSILAVTGMVVLVS